MVREEVYKEGGGYHSCTVHCVGGNNISDIVSTSLQCKPSLLANRVNVYSFSCWTPQDIKCPLSSNCINLLLKHSTHFIAMARYF